MNKTTIVFKVDDYKVTSYYKKNESQKLAVLIHGYLDNCKYMQYLEPYLEDYSLLCIEMPGHGSSSGKRADINNFKTYGKIIPNIPREILDKYPEKIYIAHSTGAVVFHEFTRQNTINPFNKVILLAPLIRSKTWLLSKFGHSLFGWALKEVARKPITNKKLQAIVEKDPNHITHTQMNWFGNLIQWNREIIHDKPSDLKNIYALFPVEDEVIDMQYSRDFYKKHFKNATVIELQNTTHRIQFDNEKIVEKFFEKLKSIIAN